MCVWQKVAGGVSFVGHGLKLDNLEDFAPPARPFLKEEGAGATVCEMQPGGYGSKWEC